eukprot:CAMPEP_0115360394 /NCGR_PEP_ID=MMETSP0270-20121206/101663_1 /TAXON_ID=71861 /ORGANISM="Scrippsiella trochoidea, Strain CCMP3099" /LENGTH=109 /DNA_ID=CAMNT_0002782925 /DNA_START=108 /DNA_END=434 /DNA_ORIENTATION=-
MSSLSVALAIDGMSVYLPQKSLFKSYFADAVMMRSSMETWARLAISALSEAQAWHLQRPARRQQQQRSGGRFASASHPTSSGAAAGVAARTHSHRPPLASSKALNNGQW